MSFITGLKAYISSGRGGGPTGPNGTLARLIVGSNVAQNKGGNVGAVTSPFAYIPDSALAEQDRWVRQTYPLGWADDASTSADGTTNVFATLTNSGTMLLGSALANYEGKTADVTGASSGNQNTYIGTAAHKSTTGRISLLLGEYWFPDPNVAAYDFYFGFGNKQVDPAGTQFTDGAWIQGVTAAGAIIFQGKTRTASGTATTVTPLFTLASGSAKSLQFGVLMLGQTLSSFFIRDATLETNPWTLQSTALTPPAATVLLRPHSAHYTRTAATHTMAIGQCSFQFERLAAF